MFFISEKEYEERMSKIVRRNESRERKRKLRDAKRKNKPKFRPPSTSKLILMGATLLCLEIVIFCEYAMIALGDTSAMYALIGVPATLIPIVLGYYSKSKAENTKNGIVYEQAMMELNKHDCVETTDSLDSEAQG